MHAQRTPLARFIDLSALWSLSLMIWFYVLLARTQAALSGAAAGMRMRRCHAGAVGAA